MSGRMSARWVAAAEVVLCSGVPSQLMLGAILGRVWLGGTFDPEAPPLSFLSVLLLSDTCVLAALMIHLTRLRGESPAALWVGPRAWTREVWRGVAFVPVLFLGAAIVLNLVRLLAPWLRNVPVNPFEAIASGSARDALLFAVVAIVAGGVKEELQRGFILRRFERELGGATVGVIVTSVAFGLGHYRQGWDAVIATAALGAVWAVMYLRRASSVAPIVSHAGFNAFEILRVALLGG